MGSCLRIELFVDVRTLAHISLSPVPSGADHESAEIAMPGT